VRVEAVAEGAGGADIALRVFFSGNYALFLQNLNIFWFINGAGIQANKLILTEMKLFADQVFWDEFAVAMRPHGLHYPNAVVNKVHDPMLRIASLHVQLLHNSFEFMCLHRT
jgi:hypothetical protein